MKLDRKKYELARARACMGQKELEMAGIPNVVPYYRWRRSKTGNSREDCKGS